MYQRGRLSCFVEQKGLTQLLQNHSTHLDTDSLHESPVAFRVVHPTACVRRRSLNQIQMNYTEQKHKHSTFVFLKLKITGFWYFPPKNQQRCGQFGNKLNITFTGECFGELWCSWHTNWWTLPQIMWHLYAIIMLFNQHPDLPHLSDGWIILTMEKCSITRNWCSKLEINKPLLYQKNPNLLL